MSQLGLFADLPQLPPRGVSWRRVPGPLGGACGATHVMLIDGNTNGAYVRHCGHPTANRPYYVALPNGDVIEQKFRLLDQAKAAAIAALNPEK